jgi:predicted PurR-regulated permease PerM
MGLIASVVVAVLQYWPNWRLIPVVVGIFVIGQAIADYVLVPYFIDSRIQLNPVWVMLAIALFGYLFGFVGILIAVPLAAAIGVLVRFATGRLFEIQSSPTHTLPSPPASKGPRKE